MQLNAIFQKFDRWYVAWVEEIPGANTQGRTLKEARENLREALRLILDTNRESSKRARRSSKQEYIREPMIVR